MRCCLHINTPQKDAEAKTGGEEKMEFITVILRWIHDVATVVWIGGMAFNISVVRPSLIVVDPSQRIKLAVTVLKRFIYFAWGCIFLLVFSGVFMVNKAISLGMYLNTPYGNVLAIKHFVLLAMVVLVAWISFISCPKVAELVKPEQPPEPTPELMKLLGNIVSIVKVNLALGFLVLLLTEIMVQLGGFV
ncbi:MAG: CopD family protein [Candidatus Hydrothermarchaeota archaeon]